MCSGGAGGRGTWPLAAVPGALPGASQGQPCWLGHRSSSVSDSPKAVVKCFCPFLFVSWQRSLPYTHRACLAAMCPRCRWSIEINESFWVWFASWFDLFCVAPWSLQTPPPPNSLRASMRVGEWTWLQFFLLKIALIFLNDCTRRISQLYRDGYFFKNIYQFYTHPTGWLREALWCYLVDTAGPRILQPLYSSFVSHAYWEEK